MTFKTANAQRLTFPFSLNLMHSSTSPIKIAVKKTLANRSRNRDWSKWLISRQFGSQKNINFALTRNSTQPSNPLASYNCCFLFSFCVHFVLLLMLFTFFPSLSIFCSFFRWHGVRGKAKKKTARNAPSIALAAKCFIIDRAWGVFLWCQR